MEWQIAWQWLLTKSSLELKHLNNTLELEVLLDENYGIWKMVARLKANIVAKHGSSPDSYIFRSPRNKGRLDIWGKKKKRETERDYKRHHMYIIQISVFHKANNGISALCFPLSACPSYRLWAYFASLHHL